MATPGDYARRFAPGLVLGVGLLVRVLFLAVASEAALVRVVPDDAYYYFKVARNAVAGQGATFDGIHPTNGYHPLWMGALLPLAGVVRDPQLFVRVALGLGVALGCGTAILLYCVVRRMTATPGGLPWEQAATLPLPPPCEGGGGSNPSPLQGEGGERVGPTEEWPRLENQGPGWWIPLLGLILYWLNPRAVVSSLNGLETSLSTFLFTLLLWLVLESAECGVRSAECSREPRAGAIGLWMGLLFLARTDNVFFIAVFWLAMVCFAERGSRLKRAALMAAAAAALAVPWVAYNWLAFGSPVQVSGLSIPYVHHELYRLQGHSSGGALLHGLKRFAVMLYEGLRGEIGYSRLISFPAIALSSLVFVVRWRREPAARRTILMLLGLGLAGLTHLFVHSAIRWHPRPWYFDQLLVLLPVVFAFALRLWLDIPDSRFQIPDSRTPSSLRHASRITRHALDGLLAALLIGLASVQTALSFDALARGEWPWAVEMLDSARWLRENTREDEAAASFNAGIIGYYSGRRVVNLDGAINNAAYEAIRRKNLVGLLRQANVRHYLDFEPMTLAHFGPFLGDAASLVEMPIVHGFGRPETAWAGSHIQVRRLVWPQRGTQQEEKSMSKPRRRDVLAAAGAGALAAALGGLKAAGAAEAGASGEYELSKLPYGYDALAPAIEEKILRLHHTKHHAAYVKGLNSTLAALAKAREAGDLASISGLSRALAFHGSGHVLHDLYWRSMRPGAATP